VTQILAVDILKARICAFHLQKTVFLQQQASKCGYLIKVASWSHTQKG